MTQTVFAVIYCALLSSRSTGTCTSSLSTVRVIVDCMRDKPAHVSKSAAQRDVPSTPILQQCRRDASHAQKCSLFTPPDTQKKNIKCATLTSRSHLRASKQAYQQSLLNRHILSRYTPFRPSNPGRSRVSSSLVGIRPGGIRATHSASLDKTRLSPHNQTELLRPFRDCMARLSSAPGDVKEAWDTLEALRVSDHLSIVPDEEFLEFLPRMYEASLLSIDPPAALSKESAARLGRLHDEVLRRAEIAVEPFKSTLKTWLNPFAVQTLLQAGKVEKAIPIVVDALVPIEGRVPAQQLALVRELFIASILQGNLEAGLLVLAKFWPRIQQYFYWYHSDQEINETAKQLRRAVLFAFKAITDGVDLLNTIEEKVAQEVGASILACSLCADQSADKIHAVYREFISNGLPMPLDIHLQFFKSLLASGAYTRAYGVRKDIFWAHPGDRTEQDIAAALRLFPELTPEAGISDALSRKAGTMTMGRFTSCINDRWAPRSDLLSIWEDVELSDCLWRRRHDGTLIILDYNIRVFAKMVIDNSCAKFGDLVVPNAKESIDLLDKICATLRRRYKRYGDAETKLRTLLWHSMILKGDLLLVRNMLVKERKGHLPDRARTITQLLLASYRLQGPNGILEHLGVLWPMIVRYIEDASRRFDTKEAQVQSESLRDTLFQMVEDIEDPAAWIAGSHATTEEKEAAVHLFCNLFRERVDLEGGLRLFEGVQARKLPLSFHAHLVLMKLLLLENCDAAARIHRSLRNLFPEKMTAPERRNKDELHVGLRLFSRLGDVTSAEEYFNVLRSRGWVDKGAQLRLLHAYGVNGDTDQVRRLFSELFVGSGNVPLARDFREIIYAHVRAGDMKGINHWLGEMLKQNIQPNLGIFNTVLLAFATYLDLNSAMATLQRMRENKVRPDHVSYCTVMSIMAENKDPVGAEQLYQRAVEEGIVPDDIMIFILMNAHVEAGSWKGVIRAFDYLQRSTRPAHLTAHLYNILLKAYVLIGAPFRTVYDIFRRFATLRLRPTEHTYALLIQSACDAGRMDIANELFTRLDDLAAQEEGASHINIYVMTIIMAGFLRLGDRDRARLVYEDMQARGIQPTAVTFGIVIKSYANERSEESLGLAEEFMRSLVGAEDSQRAWMGSGRGGRARALDAIYGPLMTIYGAQLDVTQVENYFDEMLAAGGQPGMINLTMLMDAYRRVNNLQGVKQVWEEIVKMALHISRNDPFQRLALPAPSLITGEQDPQARSPRQANILCIPLSVYISALSTAGEHIEIAKTWRQVRDWGFTFDAHNWNHLAAALVRAGEVERAFEIVERVVLPYQRQAFSFVRKKGEARTPLTFVKPQGGEGEEGEEEGEDLPTRDPRTPGRREEAVRGAAQSEGRLTPVTEDAAQQLHELQQLSFTWQAWRPHGGTLDVLRGGMRRLRSGLLVRPEGQPIPREEDIRRMDDAEAAESRAKEREAAAEILSRIYSKFPNAVHLVEESEVGKSGQGKEQASAYT